MALKKSELYSSLWRSSDQLSDMDTELSCLTARPDKTRALKQGMMQELFAGRSRLHVEVAR